VANRFRDWVSLIKGVDPGANKLPPPSARSSTLVGRAQLANFLAERSFRPEDPLPYSGADAVACELSREAIYWALLALREQQPSSGGADAPAPSAQTLASLWSETDRAVLDSAAGDSAEAERLHADLLGKSFVDFAEFDSKQQSAAAKRLHGFAGRLIEPLAAPQQLQDRVWVARIQFLLVALVALVLLGFAGRSLKHRYDLTQDLAPTASWKASSVYPECWCDSPAQSCEKCPNFFFHTHQEDNPSVIFDLHSVQSLSAVVVENRRDCCSERGLPLVIQVSTDEKNWKTVATRKTEFSLWRADFPTEQARWVKLYVPNNNFLHLAAVRLLP
jgi:hypothetical protein